MNRRFALKGILGCVASLFGIKAVKSDDLKVPDPIFIKSPSLEWQCLLFNRGDVVKIEYLGDFKPMKESIDGKFAKVAYYIRYYGLPDHDDLRISLIGENYSFWQDLPLKDVKLTKADVVFNKFNQIDPDKRITGPKQGLL